MTFILLLDQDVVVREVGLVIVVVISFFHLLIGISFTMISVSSHLRQHISSARHGRQRTTRIGPLRYQCR